MRKIAIIGSGQAALLAAHGLLKGGYDVTLFSDRTPEQWLNESTPTGTAARFDLSLAFERELGLNHWEAEAPKGEGVHLTFCPAANNRLLTLAGRLDRYFVAIDLRLQSHRWLKDLEARGGKVEIERVTLERLDEIAAEHDLTVVAAGRGPVADMFERDAGRSVYDKAQRKLLMIIATGAPLGFEGVPLLPVKFNFFGPIGEAFYVPYYHKDHGPCWNMILEAKPGTPFDRFDHVENGEQAVEAYKNVIREVIPWDWEWGKNLELADPRGWLKGAVTPTVKKPVGRLPSGRICTPLGDTAMVLDPIGGQGANNGNKMARNLVECVIANGEKPFDAAWMTATFEKFYARHGHPTYTFNNVLLEPITDPGKALLIAQYGSTGLRDVARYEDVTGPQAIADAFILNFEDPATLTDAFLDMATARRVIETKTGRPAWFADLRGKLGIGRGQIRQKIGLAPNHPSAQAVA